MLRLRAVLWRPSGRGPFPAVFFSHGSGHAAGSPFGPNQRHPEILGPLFAKHGYVFLYLYRRGDGLSAGQGTESGDLMDRALATDGEEARDRLQVQLLETDEMSDALAGLTLLRSLPEVDPQRVAVVGHSFGGALTLLLAAHDTTLRAAVVFATAAYGWVRSAQLRRRLLTAIEHTAIPIFFIHAANDYSIAPAESLGTEMTRLGKPHRVKIYPPVGRTVVEGHDFVHLRTTTWEPDVFAFLDEYLRR
ncbi:MAG TPA: alpha/beta fold hydrolase [Gemmatimonadales bacterium]|nr:alpha/beta fold hydrolase [Gemmatimonadales bacterium]